MRTDPCSKVLSLFFFSVHYGNVLSVKDTCNHFLQLANARLPMHFAHFSKANLWDQKMPLTCNSLSFGTERSCYLFIKLKNEKCCLKQLALYYLKPELGTKHLLLAGTLFFRVLDKSKAFSISESSNQNKTNSHCLKGFWLSMNILTNKHIICIYSKRLTCALIFPVDVLQVEAIMALADVTPKCVDALTETWTNRLTCGTFIHICKTNTPIHHFSTL